MPRFLPRAPGMTLIVTTDTIAEGTRFLPSDPPAPSRKGTAG